MFSAPEPALECGKKGRLFQEWGQDVLMTDWDCKSQPRSNMLGSLGCGRGRAWREKAENLRHKKAEMGGGLRTKSPRSVLAGWVGCTPGRGFHGLPRDEAATGGRWIRFGRGWCFGKAGFRDFVLSRIEGAEWPGVSGRRISSWDRLWNSLRVVPQGYCCGLI